MNALHDRPVRSCPAQTAGPGTLRRSVRSPRQGPDEEVEVLECRVTQAPGETIALKYLKKSLKHLGYAEVTVTGELRSSGAALCDLGMADREEFGRRDNDHAGNPTNRRLMRRIAF